MDEQQTAIRRLRWRRRLIMAWPCIAAAVCTYVCYRQEVASIVSWLLANGVPLTRWLDFIEIDNQLSPVIFFGVVTLLTLFQRPFGYALFFLASVVVAGISTVWLLDFYSTGSRSDLLFLSWVLCIIGWLTVLSLIATLLAVIRIDEKLVLSTSPQIDADKPNQDE